MSRGWRGASAASRPKRKRRETLSVTVQAADRTELCGGHTAQNITGCKIQMIKTGKAPTLRCACIFYINLFCSPHMAGCPTITQESPLPISTSTAVHLHRGAGGQAGRAGGGGLCIRRAHLGDCLGHGGAGGAGQGGAVQVLVGQLHALHVLLRGAQAPGPQGAPTRAVGAALARAPGVGVGPAPH